MKPTDNPTLMIFFILLPFVIIFTGYYFFNIPIFADTSKVVTIKISTYAYNCDFNADGLVNKWDLKPLAARLGLVYVGYTKYE